MRNGKSSGKDACVKEIDDINNRLHHAAFNGVLHMRVLCSRSADSYCDWTKDDARLCEVFARISGFGKDRL